MSQSTPEPRSGGPVRPHSIASSGEITPMPTVRRFQMRLFVSSAAYSSMHGSNLSTNAASFPSHCGVTSYGCPPIFMQLSVRRAPQ